MRQQAFPAARPGEAEFFHNDRLFRFGNHRAVKVGALAVLITLKFLETALVVEPLVSQEFATIHATDRNDHRTTLSGESNGPQLCQLRSFLGNRVQAPGSNVLHTLWPRYHDSDWGDASGRNSES